MSERATIADWLDAIKETIAAYTDRNEEELTGEMTLRDFFPDVRDQNELLWEIQDEHDVDLDRFVNQSGTSLLDIAQVICSEYADASE